MLFPPVVSGQSGRPVPVRTSASARLRAKHGTTAMPNLTWLIPARPSSPVKQNQPSRRPPAVCPGGGLKSPAPGARPLLSRPAEAARAKQSKARPRYPGRHAAMPAPAPRPWPHSRQVAFPSSRPPTAAGPGTPTPRQRISGPCWLTRRTLDEASPLGLARSGSDGPSPDRLRDVGPARSVPPAGPSHPPSHTFTTHDANAVDSLGPGRACIPRPERPVYTGSADALMPALSPAPLEAVGPRVWPRVPRTAGPGPVPRRVIVSLSRLARFLGFRPRPAAAARTVYRPCLEELENRLVPTHGVRPSSPKNRTAPPRTRPTR